MGRTMTRHKKRQRMDTPQQQPDDVLKAEDVAELVGQLLTPKRYVPPNCSACEALRPKPDESYVYVYHTRRDRGYIFHYCKCGFCGNPFKHAEKV